MFYLLHQIWDEKFSRKCWELTLTWVFAFDWNWTLNRFHISLLTSKKEVGTQFVFTLFQDCILMIYPVNRKLLPIHNLFQTRKAVAHNKTFVHKFFFPLFNLRRKDSSDIHIQTLLSKIKSSHYRDFSMGKKNGVGCGGLSGLHSINTLPA